MPKKSSKKGGAFAYVDQFDYPLSPCYKPTGKPQIPKLGWHAGGSCLDNKTVAQMGIIDKPACTQPSASEVAWINRYSKMTGGEAPPTLLGELLNAPNTKPNKNNNKKPQVAFLSEQVTINTNKNNKKPQVTNNSTEMQNTSVINKLKQKIEANQNKNAVFSINANKNGENYKISVFYTPSGNKKFQITIQPSKKVTNNNNARNQLNNQQYETFNYNSVNGIANRIKNFQLKNVSQNNKPNNNSTRTSNGSNNNVPKTNGSNNNAPKTNGFNNNAPKTNGSNNNAPKTNGSNNNGNKNGNGTNNSGLF